MYVSELSCFARDRFVGYNVIVVRLWNYASCLRTPLFSLLAPP